MSSLLIGYWSSLVFFDNDYRYWFFIRYPDQMKKFESIKDKMKEKRSIKKLIKIFETSNIHDSVDYHNFRTVLSESLWDSQQKTEKLKEKKTKS